MRLVSYDAGSGRRLGVLDGSKIVDPAASLGCHDDRGAWFSDVASFIASGAEGRAMAEAARDGASVALEDVRLLAPMLPTTILATGSNYKAHNDEKANTPTSGKHPEFFVLTSDSVVGPDDPIVCDPRLTEKLDVETELAIVVGTPGRHIPTERALEHVFGYTILNDVTARDLQVRTTPRGSRGMNSAAERRSIRALRSGRASSRQTR